MTEPDKLTVGDVLEIIGYYANDKAMPNMERAALTAYKFNSKRDESHKESENG